jgi:sigma-B regulation protein RsbU (phosphoserine phosphatase)
VLLTRLNDLILRSTDSRNYMTLAVFAYDAGSRRGELTNSGQLAPYRISGGQVESLSLPSFPLGVATRSDFPTRTWQFAPGDRLVFVTDGFVEALGPSDEPFGFERLEDVIRSHAAADPRQLRDALLDAVARYTGGAPLEDDRTLAILAFE